MTFILAICLLASIIILFIVVLKCCLKRYENTNFQTQQSQTLSTHLPYNPDPLQSSNYFPSAPSQLYNTRPSNFNQPVHSGTLPPTMMIYGPGHPGVPLGTRRPLPAAQWANQSFASTGGTQTPVNPNLPRTVPDLPPSYVVASELLDPPPSYIEALKSPR